MMEKKEYLIAAVAERMKEVGYRMEGVPESSHAAFRPDATFHHDHRPPVHMEAKILGACRSQIFPALIGDLILRFRHEESDVAILLAVLLRRISASAIRDFQDYARKYLPDLNWFIVDEAGAGHFCLHGIQERFSLNDPWQAERRRVPRIAGGNLFTANNQWLLKILLLAGMDRKYWGGPIDHPDSITQLAKASGIPQPSVSSFISKFEREGFVRRVSGRLLLRRHEELLNDWFHSIKYGIRSVWPVRPLYGAVIDEREILEKARAYNKRMEAESDAPGVVIGHHLACHLLELGRSNVRVARIYSHHPFEEIMAAIDLVSDESGSSGISLVKSGAVKSIQKGSVRVGRLPVCDVLQCYLDVRSSQARGREQSDFLFERILQPHFRRNG